MINKLLSGRFILTIVASVVFMLGAINRTIPEEAVVAVIMFVVQAYFNRSDRNQKGA